MPSIKFRLRAIALLCLALGACGSPPAQSRANTKVLIPTVADAALSWHAPAYANVIYGLRLLQDGPPTTSVTLAITRVVLWTNPKLAPIDALQLADATVRAARAQSLPPEFLAALLLQESAFDPRAMSSAGAIGIAQFMPETAAGAGVDPFDPFDAIAGSAELIGGYVRVYSAIYANPLVDAMAAYNAGPAAVSAYKGVPPYPETREYVDYVLDRWAKITSDEKPISRP